MKDFTPTPYTLECVATGREFEDTGWMLADPQCKTPSLVRACLLYTSDAADE